MTWSLPSNQLNIQPSWLLYKRNAILNDEEKSIWMNEWINERVNVNEYMDGVNTIDDPTYNNMTDQKREKKQDKQTEGQTLGYTFLYTI